MVKKVSSKNIDIEPIIHITIVVLVMILLVNFFLINNLSSTVKKKIDYIKEASRPAELQLTIINSDCTKCYNINQVVDLIKKNNVNITKETVLSKDDAFNLINKYNIDKLPTVIVTGETNKTDLSFLSKFDDKYSESYLFSDVPLPYYSIKSNKVKGLVNAKIINPSNCIECFDMSKVVTDLKSGGISINEINNFNEDEAKDLINKYNIDSLPALILSSDASEYSLLKDSWKSYGNVAFDGSYISSNYFPPFKNMTTGMINGLVSITYLTDSSCKECYNVMAHKKIIEGFDIKLSKEETFDISSSNGKELLSKYNITLVPTIIVSSDAKYYGSFMRAFSKVSKENVDGSLTFNKLEVMGSAYKDLLSNKIIKVDQDGQ